MLVALLFAGCNSQQMKHNTNKYEHSDSSHIIPNAPIINVDDYEIIKDTLRIISTSKFLYYPFGIHNDTKEFIKHHPFLHDFVEPITFASDDSGIITNLYCFNFKNSQISFLLDSQTKNLELVSAKILDQEIVINSQINIGVSKNKFITGLNDKIAIEKIENVKVIELVSGLTGIWQYYTFNDDKLSSVTIITDYQIENH